MQEAEYENDQALPSLGGQLFPSLGWLVPSLGGGASGGGRGRPFSLLSFLCLHRMLDFCKVAFADSVVFMGRGGGCFIKVFGLHKENVMISPILHRCD